MDVEIKIAKQFSETPGARYITDGKYSGEEFRQALLEPAFLKVKGSRFKVVVDLDGTDGYATSFLDETFGGLARIHGADNVLLHLTFVSFEEPFLINEIKQYINESK